MWRLGLLHSGSLQPGEELSWVEDGAFLGPAHYFIA